MTTLLVKFMALSGLCLSACAAQTSTQASAQSSAVSTEKFVEEHATIKPGAAVSLQSSFEDNMSAQIFNRVDLKFSEYSTEGLLNVSVEPSEGLSIFGGSTDHNFDMSTTNLHQLSLDVSAETDGLYFLNVFAESKGQVRTFSVSLKIGTVTEEMMKATRPQNGEMRDGVRVLEAQETIR